MDINKYADAITKIKNSYEYDKNILCGNCSHVIAEIEVIPQYLDDSFLIKITCPNCKTINTVEL